ncbi:M42 family metallopeptidase [Candidatus Oscillochloris fontis]|uniref:M42 family metallopeptidase n=1 Tax=Candidatus Oscillochloris fontis TaxID=2496868 RepID=UPI00101D2D93
MEKSHPRIGFLKRLLSTPGPSGDEVAPARLWREEARSFADTVYADVSGNSYALIDGTGPRILLMGHIDEIGLMVSYIDDSGYLFFAPIGGWDSQVLVGQRVRLLGHAGEVVGVIGKKPIHLLKPDERTKVTTIEQMWIDIGATSREEAQEWVRVGCVGVIDAPLYELPNQRIVSRSLDNRIGAFTVLEALRLLSQDRPAASVAAVASTQEEITFAGASTAAFSFDPQVAIVVDVTFATDHPQSDKQQHSDVKLGGGPVLARGSANSPLVYERLLQVAAQEGIPYALQIAPRYTGTDADAIYKMRGGIATGVVSIPNRYMHSPNEMIALADVDAAARLIAAFVRSVRSAEEFIPAL